MRKYLLSLVLLLVCVAIPLNAQMMKYQYSVGSTTFTPITGASGFTLIGTVDEGYSAPVAIGFPFTYAGATYDSFQVSTNGFIRLGSGLTSATSANALTGLTRRIIAPLWDDLSVADSASLTYVVTGTSPNRVLTVEWRNVKWTGTAATPNAEFQLKLFETTGNVQFIYGTFGTPGTSATASIGMCDNSTLSTANRGTGTFISFNIGGTAGSRVYYQTQGLEFAAVAQAPDAGTIITFTQPGTPLTGTYTVGGITPDFATLSEAANALNVRGVSGPVTINIRPGTYEDVFHVINVTGASNTNRITVKNESGVVTISPRYGARTSATVLAGDGMIRLDGASYFTIEGLNLVDNALNTTNTLKYEFGVVLSNGEVSPLVTSGSRFNVLKNLFIDLDANTVANTSAIGIRMGTTVGSSAVDTSFANSYNTFQDLTIERFWRAAIQLYGFSGFVPDRGNKITAVTGRNAFRNVTVISSGSDIRAIEANAQEDLLVEKTDIYDLIVTSTGWTTNVVSGFRYNPANSTTDFNRGNLIIRDVKIYNLELQQTQATTGSVLGIEVIRLFQNSTLTINNVSISDLYTNGSGAALARGIAINAGAGTGLTTTVNIYNNLIYDIRAPRSTGAPSVRALDLQNSIGGVMYNNVYYNTTYLDNAVAPTVTTHQSASVYIANFGTSNLDLRNNIFVNTMVSQTRAVNIYASANSNLLRLTPTSNNNLYYAGVPSATNLLAYDAATSFQTLAAYKQAVFTGGLGGPRELNTVTEMPPFVSAVAPYDLNLQTAVLTAAESGARPVTGITTDYAGAIRSTTAPDIGAFEFNGTGADVLPPYMSFTPLSNTGAVGARTLVVNVTDRSGVPTAAPGWPTLYWKVGALGSYTAASPTNVASGNYTFSFGATAVLGDTVFYYVASQDNAGTPNVGVIPFNGAAGFTANPPAVSTPPTNPYGYIITNAALAGDYTVGIATFNKITGRNIYFEKSVRKVMKEVWHWNERTDKESEEYPLIFGEYDETKGSFRLTEVEEVNWTPMENGAPYTGSLIAKKADYPQYNYPAGTEGVYATLTAAINDLNTRGVSANVNFLLTDTLYSTGEVFPYIPFINNENQPAANKQVTIKPAAGVTARISGTSASGIIANYLDYFNIDGSNSGGTDRNLIIENTSTATSTYVLAIFNYLNSDPATNNTIKNCIIRAGSNVGSSTVVNYGIIMNYAGGGYNNTVITNNQFQKMHTGIQFVGVSNNPSANCSVTNNIFGDDDNTLTIGNMGMLASYVTNATISGNTFKNIQNASTNPRGIWVYYGAVNSTVSANTFRSIFYTGTGGYGGKGIDVQTATQASNVTIVNNVLTGMGGDGWSTLSTDANIGIRVLGVSGGIKVYYNSINLFGTWSRTTGTLSAGIYVQNGASGIELKNNSISNSIFNALTTGVPKAYAIAFDGNVNPFVGTNYNNYFVSGAQSVFALYGLNDQANIAAWRTASGSDANSKDVNPQYTDTLNLRPVQGSGLFFAGTPITGITTDILGATRTSTPSMGAYEFPAGVNVGWANLQWPASATVLVGRNTTVYGQIWVNGITNQPGQAVGINAWLGYSTQNTDPATWTNWLPATYNVDVGNNDEYMTNIGATLPAGTYYYAYRWQVYGGDYYYGGYSQGGGGQWNGTTNVSGVLTVQAPFSVNWEFSAAGTNLPSWFSASANTERGLAWGMVNYPTEGLLGRVVVATRTFGNSVKLLNDSTGVLTDSLNVTGITGGAIQLNDVDVDHLGRIYACNVTTSAATDPFKVYRWDNVTSAPKVVLSYTGDAIRFGDKFTIANDPVTNGVVIWAASATTGQPKVYKWRYLPGQDSINHVPEVILLSDNITTGIGSASVGPLPNGDFYWNAGGQSARKYQANGTLIGVIPGTVVATGSNAIRYIGSYNGSEFFATFQYGTGNQNARIVEVPNGDPTLALTYGVSTPLGANANANGTGDVAVKNNYDGSKTVFVLATNNGLGSYKAVQNIPVELTSFKADVQERNVVVSWTTATEINSASFNVERTLSGSNNWSTVATVAAAGTSTEMRSYSYIDKGLNTAKYQYRLKQIDLDGTYSYSKVVEVEVGLPTTFSMSQNYPNPFNPTTRIEYQVPVDARVSLELYDVAGQRVATLLSSELAAGYYSFDLTAGRFGLSSGVYFYRLTAVESVSGKQFVNTKKMVMLK